MQIIGINFTFASRFSDLRGGLSTMQRLRNKDLKAGLLERSRGVEGMVGGAASHQCCRKREHPWVMWGEVPAWVLPQPGEGIVLEKQFIGGKTFLLTVSEGSFQG